MYFLFQAFLAWFIIIASIWVAVEAENIGVSALAIILVASRQNVLALLVHDQAHCRAFKAGSGDSFVNFIAGYPLIALTVEAYSQVHLSHHKYFMTSQDPDLLRKSGDHWTFPMGIQKFGKLLISDLFGATFWALIKGKKMENDFPLFKRPQYLPKWVQFAYYAIIATIITVTHSWGIVLLYWFLPLLTVLQVMVRWGAVCEHLYIPEASIEECSPIIILTWWEKILFPNLNFTLHPYHHYFPGVPFCDLPKVHEIFKNEGLINEDHIFYGNYSYFRFLMKREAELEVRQV